VIDLGPLSVLREPLAVEPFESEVVEQAIDGEASLVPALVGKLAGDLQVGGGLEHPDVRAYAVGGPPPEAQLVVQVLAQEVPQEEEGDDLLLARAVDLEHLRVGAGSRV
jgi:hypothetical protein